jgi:hypothetical protein
MDALHCSERGQSMIPKWKPVFGKIMLKQRDRL